MEIEGGGAIDAADLGEELGEKSEGGGGELEGEIEGELGVEAAIFDSGREVEWGVSLESDGFELGVLESGDEGEIGGGVMKIEVKICGGESGGRLAEIGSGEFEVAIGIVEGAGGGEIGGEDATEGGSGPEAGGEFFEVEIGGIEINGEATIGGEEWGLGRKREGKDEEAGDDGGFGLGDFDVLEVEKVFFGDEGSGEFGGA